MRREHERKRCVRHNQEKMKLIRQLAQDIHGAFGWNGIISCARCLSVNFIYALRPHWNNALCCFRKPTSRRARSSRNFRKMEKQNRNVRNKWHSENLNALKSPFAAYKHCAFLEKVSNGRPFAWRAVDTCLSHGHYRWGRLTCRNWTSVC